MNYGFSGGRPIDSILADISSSSHATVEGTEPLLLTHAEDLTKAIEYLKESVFENPEDDVGAELLVQLFSIEDNRKGSTPLLLRW